MTLRDPVVRRDRGAPVRGTPRSRGGPLLALSLGAGALLMLATEPSLWRLVALLGVTLGCLVVAWRLAASPAAPDAVTRGSVEGLVGVVSVVVAGVIAFAWWPAVGVAGETVGAGLCILGGAGLALLGAVHVFRGVRGWWWPVAVLTSLVLGYAFMMPLAVAVYATQAPPSATHPVRPASLPTSREVTLVTADGVSLNGWYVPSTNHAAVVLRHGSSSDRTAVLPHAEVLARHGYGVLMLDARGHGSSGGQAMKFGWDGDKDIAASVDYLQRRPDVDPTRIGAVGLSMGGEEAIGAMAGDDRIRATVAEGATNRVLADRAWIADTYGIRGRLQLGVDRVTYALTDLLSPASPPLPLADAVATAAPRPLLLIAGGATEEPIADLLIQKRAPRSVQLWVVPSAGHTAALRTDPAGWDHHVVTYLDATLR